MNNDLISRTSLLRNIGRYGASIDPYNITRLITQKILGEHAVDAEPVRHGRWINKSEMRHGIYDYRFDCSECGHIFWAGGVENFNFCPNCGAKTDGDKDAAD